MPRLFPRAAALAAVFSAALFLNGCTSISRGVTEAVLEYETEDTRQCRMDGPAFPGLRQSVAAAHQGGVTKVLMVHGISHHTPGYSARFRDRLSAALGMDVIDPEIKTLRLLPPGGTGTEKDDSIGILRISRHASTDQSKAMMFYELTWSGITEGQKKSIAYDTDNTDGLERSGINKKMKGFLNSTVPDLLIYMGNGHDKITTAVRESVCWMFTHNWQDLPADDGAYICQTQDNDVFANIARDDFFFITHSLGSRITIDTIQSFATENKNSMSPAMHEKIRAAVADKKFTVYMMANQLPLLQLGRAAPVVTDKIPAYCPDNAPRSAERVLKELDIIAFSDPNDILSYPVPDNFAREHIDSRICPQITNISLNVAPLRNIFGTTSFADPLTAHNGYLEDDRVIGILTDGVSRGKMSPLVAEKCQWQEERPLD